MESLTINDYYRKMNIFITGGTGFVGKALIEKLLRAFPDLGDIYILVRTKRGVNIAQRTQDIFKNSLFDHIRTTDVSRFKKLIPIHGDITLPGLGMSDDDRRNLMANINIIIHSAATIRFNEPLKDATVMNTLGTKQMLELAVKCAHLKKFIHISTAYSNSDKRYEIFEKLYAPPADPHEMIRLTQTLNAADLNSLEAKVLGDYPNTYTFTKSMGETLVSQYADRVPVVIIRPAIIMNSWTEPYEGWIEHPTGIVGIMMEIGRGLVNVLQCPPENQIDVVPVDYVVNTIIAAGWHTHVKQRKDLAIYNCCTSGVCFDTLNYRTLTQNIVIAARKNPSKHLMGYPYCYCLPNYYIAFMAKLIMHFLPALLTDVWMICSRKKPRMFKYMKKVQALVDSTQFFQMETFLFNSQNMSELITDLRQVSDGDCLNIDIANLNWNEYIDTSVQKIRELILKDDKASLKYGRRRMFAFYWFQKFLQLLFLCIAYQIFASISF